MNNLFQYIRLARKKPYLILKGINGLLSVNFLNRKAIRGAEIAVTYDCQGKCEKCSCRRLVKKGEKELTLEQILGIGNKIANMGAILINVTGGEPLLRSDILEIVKGMGNMPVLISLTTNGLLLRETMIRDLKRAGLDVIQISLNSPHQIEHDEEIGVEGSYQKVLMGIRKAKDAGIEVIINTVLTRKILHSDRMTKIVDIASKNRSLLSLVLPARVGCWSDKDVSLTADDYKIIEHWLRYKFITNDIKTSYKNGVCPAGREKIYISPYGDVYPCPFIHDRYGNVMDDEIRHIWNKMNSLTNRVCVNVGSDARERL